MSRPLSSESAFRALAHPARRRIVQALRKGDEVAAGMLLPPNVATRPNLSTHLRALQNAGLIVFRRQGTRLMYRLNVAALKPVEQFLASLKRVD